MTVADHTPPHLANIAAPAYATHVGEWGRLRHRPVVTALYRHTAPP
jgi:hypothetical protein